MTSIQRVFSVLFSPGKTFQAIAERPTWAVALIVLLIVGAVGSAVVLSKIDPAAQERMIRDQVEHRLEGRGASRAEIDAATEQAVKVSEKIRPIQPVIALVFMTIFYPLVALLFWGGVTLAGGRAGFVQMFSTTLHGLMPLGLQGLISIPIALSQGSLDPKVAESGSLLASNLAVFAPEGGSAVVTALLSSVDFFSIWSIVLLIVGFSVTTRISKSASAAVVIGCWLIGIALKVGFAALGS